MSLSIELPENGTCSFESEGNYNRDELLIKHGNQKAARDEK